MPNPDLQVREGAENTAVARGHDFVMIMVAEVLFRNVHFLLLGK